MSDFDDDSSYDSETDGVLNELMYACKHGDLEKVKFELNNYNIEETNRDGYTALLFACDEYNFDVVKYLVEKGANVNVVADIGKLTPLILICGYYHFAYNDNYLETVKLLIDYGANVDFQDEFGRTALHHACKYHHIEAVHILVSAGANVNIQDMFGETALHFSVEENYSNHETQYEKILFLLNHNADPNIVGNDGTPLFLVCENYIYYHNPEDFDIIKLLVKYGANPDIPCEDGTTCLFLSSFVKNPQHIESSKTIFNFLVKTMYNLENVQ